MTRFLAFGGESVYNDSRRDETEEEPGTGSGTPVCCHGFPVSEERKWLRWIKVSWSSA
jgi:hypothetical protein